MDAHGASNRLTLDSVTFLGCTLEATHGADVNATDCVLSNAKLSVLASGTTTKVSLHACQIRGCETGVVAIGGASVEVNTGSSIQCMGAGYCISAQGPGSSIVSNGSTMSLDTKSRVSELWLGCAAAVHGAAVCVRGPRNDSRMFRAFAADGPGSVGGVLVHGDGTNAALSDCDLSVSAYAVSAVAGGKVTLERCTSSGGASGLRVTGAGSTVDAEGCTVSQCVQSCADANAGGHLKLVKCSLCSSLKSSGVRVFGGGTHAALTDCTVAGNAQWGMHVGGGATADIQRGKAEKNIWDGLYVCEGAKAELSAFNVLSSKRGGGVFVNNPGSVVEANRCDFSNNSLHGARAYDGSTLRAVACNAFQNGSRTAYSAPVRRSASGSAGLAASGQGRSGFAHTHAAMGLILADEADLRTSACGFYAHGCKTQVFATRECAATRNCAGGFVAAHGAQMEVADSAASANGGPGAAAHRQASVRLSNSAFTDSVAGSGVELYAGTTAVMTGCRASGNSRCGVRAQDGAAVTVHGLHALHNNEDGLLLVGSGAMPPGAAHQGASQTSADVKACTCKSNAGCGVHVKLGAKVKAHALHALGNAEDGVLVTGSCSSMVGVSSSEDGHGDSPRGPLTAERNKRCGFHVQHGAVMTSHALHAEHNDGVGLLAEGSGSSASVGTLTVASNRGGGVIAQTLAQLTVESCTARSNSLAGIHVRDRSEARLQSATVHDTVGGSGVTVAESSTVKLLFCDVARSAGHGVWVRHGGSAKVTGHTGQSRIANNVLSNVQVDTSGAAMLDSALLLGSVQGSGLCADGEDASVVLTECCLQENRGCGAMVQAGAALACQRSTTLANAQTGVDVQSGSTVHLTGVHLLGSTEGGGLLARGVGTAVAAVRCVVLDNAAAGVDVRDGARVEVKRSSTARNATAGAVVDQSSRLDMSASSSEDETAFLAPSRAKGALVRVGCTP